MYIMPPISDCSASSGPESTSVITVSVSRIPIQLQLPSSTSIIVFASPSSQAVPASLQGS